MSKKDGLWELFEKTGLPEVYLVYREEASLVRKETNRNGEEV